jgi:hypothetical protein
MIRARDAVRIFFGKHFPNRVTSARLRRKENGVHHLNESKGGKSLLSNCGKWRQNPVVECDKLRQIRCRLLSPFAAHYNGTFFAVTNRKGMVSIQKTLSLWFILTPFYGWRERRKLPTWLPDCVTL